MKYKFISGAAVLLSAAMVLSACGTSSATANASPLEQVSVQAASNLPDATPVDADTSEVSDAFSNRDLSGTYDAASAVRITLNGASASSDSGAVTVSGSTITITAAGTYLLSGTLYNGTVIVDAGKEDKVQIVLDNATINSDDFAAIYVRQADKVFLTLPDGTVNTLSNGGTFTAIDDNNVDGVIFSKDDLTLNGTGKLVVTSPAKHGIVCKDDLVITDGAYEITAASHAISAKDSFSVAGGTFTLTAGKDGVHVENDEDAERGNLYIASATITVTADGDGVSASGTLRIDGGTFALKVGGGVQNARTASDESRKGLKADGNLILNGGAVAIDAADDGIHSNADIAIKGGNYAIAVGDDGIHADGLVQIDAGTMDINAYEGIEGTYIRINDGTVNIYASDDGINAARKSGAYSPTVEINGGQVTVEVGPGDTDGIDSNGALIITGGTIDVTGNSAFDYDGSLTFSGGTVIINGQQVDTITGQMFGRGGMGRNFGGNGNFGNGTRGGRMPSGGATTPDSNTGNGTRGSKTPDSDAGNNATTPDANAGNGTRGGKMPKGTAPDTATGATPDANAGRGGKSRPTDGTGTESVTPDGRMGKRGGKGQKQTELPDAATTPAQNAATQKIAAI